jgi:hypothetical protein
MDGSLIEDLARSTDKLSKLIAHRAAWIQERNRRNFYLGPCRLAEFDSQIAELRETISFAMGLGRLSAASRTTVVPDTGAIPIARGRMQSVFQVGDNS